MDPSVIESTVKSTAENYSSQSWGKLEMTYEILPQQEFTLNWSEKIGQANGAAQQMLRNQGYYKDYDYDGILFIYNKLGGDGDFCCNGGKAYIAGKFATVAYVPSYIYRVTRHEIGHNFGHYHHVMNHYDYRDTRPYPSFRTDGFDFMSGGNVYERSDFGIASKWFYNWVPEQSVISMQPEGRTSECPSCVKSGTFTLKPFDNWLDAPNNDDILGVHIPVFSIYDDYWETETVSIFRYVNSGFLSDIFDF